MDIQARTETTQQDMKAKMNISQEEMKASPKEMMPNMKTQTGCLVPWMDAWHEEMKACQKTGRGLHREERDQDREWPGTKGNRK
jgi:hypothetical protein